MEKIYNLKFGESREVSTKITNEHSGKLYTVDYIITRIPGGWLFKEDLQISELIFVPFNNEFQKREYHEQ
ncbi:MAG: hypothetical protein PF569_01810 [Candidatus Woesearchaeota archaeon]|jgi:hypothetical protein|nr:hypothetical protein [Candidatus Woesearchaeota archaeon]